MFEVQISEEALLDLDDAMDFYSNISFDLGEKFMKQFDESVLQLENIPFFQIRYSGVRIRKIKTFPITLHYVINEASKTVVVYGVRFAKENPENFPKT